MKTELAIVEHYIPTNPSGLLLIDSSGVSNRLIVWDDETMRAHLEIAELYNAAQELIDGLRN